MSSREGTVLGEKLQSPDAAKRNRDRNRPRKKRKPNDNEVAVTKMPAKLAGLKPNFFLALQVQNSIIVGNIERVQRAILQLDPSLAETRVPASKSHVTLQVFNAKESSLVEIDQAMRKAVLEIPQIDLHFEGIGTFNNKVVFARANSNDALQLLWRSVVDELLKVDGIDMKVDKEFNPHLTIMKTSRARSVQVKKKKIMEELYLPFLDLDFGVETCLSLQLLSMTKPPDKNGYYHKFLDVPLEGSVAVKTLAMVEGEERLREPVGHNNFAQNIQSVLLNPRTLIVCSLIAMAALLVKNIRKH